MSEQTFYENIKPDLEKNWRNVDEIYEASPSTFMGSKMGMNPHKFGFVIWDWNKQFKTKLKQIWLDKLSGDGLNSIDPNAYNINQLGIPFQYIEQLPQWNKTANWNDVGEVMGRFETQSVYGNSSAQELSLTLNYYAESANDKRRNTEYNNSIKNDWTMTLIERVKMQLQSITFPQYDGKFSPPVKVLLNIGNIFNEVPVVIKSVAIEEGPPYEIDTMRAMFKRITIEMRTSYPAWQTISAPKVWTADHGGIFARQELQYITT